MRGASGVEQVEVTGLSRMDRMTVYAVALDQKSRAMPLVDLEAVREKLLAYGWIADAHVSRRLPDTLLVHIVERQPTAVWQDHGKLSLIAANGVWLEPVKADAMPDLPLVIGPGAIGRSRPIRLLIAAARAQAAASRQRPGSATGAGTCCSTPGETLALPEGDDDAAKALVKFAQIDGSRPLLGKGWIRFDMRDPAKLVARKPGEVSNRSIADPNDGTVSAHPAVIEAKHSAPTVNQG